MARKKCEHAGEDIYWQDRAILSMDTACYYGRCRCGQAMVEIYHYVETAMTEEDRAKAALGYKIPKGRVQGCRKKK